MPCKREDWENMRNLQFALFLTVTAIAVIIKIRRPYEGWYNK